MATWRRGSPGCSGRGGPRAGAAGAARRGPDRGRRGPRQAAGARAPRALRRSRRAGARSTRRGCSPSAATPSPYPSAAARASGPAGGPLRRRPAGVAHGAARARPRWRSSGPGGRRRTGPRSPTRSDAGLGAAGRHGRERAGAGHRRHRRTAAASTAEARRWPSWRAVPSGPIPAAHSAPARAGGRARRWWCPSCRRAPARSAGASRRATGSWPGSHE